MEVSYRDRTFSAELKPLEKFPNVFTCNIAHYEHVKKEVKTDTIVQSKKQVETDELDEAGKPIYREVESSELVTLIKEEFVTSPVNVGKITLYTKPSNIDLRNIVRNWLEQSGVVDKILEKYASKEKAN